MDEKRFNELRELVRLGGATSAYREGLREALDQIEEQAAELRRLLALIRQQASLGA